MKNKEALVALGLTALLSLTACGNAPSTAEIEAINKIGDAQQPFAPQLPSTLYKSIAENSCQQDQADKLEGVGQLIQTLKPKSSFSPINDLFQLSLVSQNFSLADTLSDSQSNHQELTFTQNRTLSDYRNSQSNDLSAVLTQGPKFLVVKAVLIDPNQSCQVVTSQTVETALDPQKPDPNSPYWKLISKNACDPENPGNSGQHFRLENDLHETVSDAFSNDVEDSNCSSKS